MVDPRDRGLARPAWKVDSAWRRRPRVPLFGNAAVRGKPEQRRSGDRFHLTVVARDHGPPVDSRPIVADDRLTEAHLEPGLFGERPGRILSRRLCLAKRVREEDRVVGIERCDRPVIALGPGLEPAGDPRLRGSPRVYFATSIARLSRITMTFTWPGYSS